MNFMAKTNHVIDIHVSYKNNQINNAHGTDFIGLTSNSTLSWKTHINQLASKLNSACFAILFIILFYWLLQPTCGC